ncbi:MAG: hypothetical protein ACYTDW_22625, partial [Planctomycetota bacterium]
LRDQPSSTQDIAVVNDDVIVPPGGFVVFCHTLSANFNGGVVCDYEYGHFSLTNTADELILDFDGTIVDEVWYDEKAGWPQATSGSLNLDPNAFLLDNNDPNNWCNSPAGPEIPNTPTVGNNSLSKEPTFNRAQYAANKQSQKLLSITLYFW